MMGYRLALIRTSVIALPAFALLATGCGSSTSTSASSASSASSGGHLTQAQMLQDAVNFSDCMRSHGVPGFPDPTDSPREFKQSLDPSLPHSPSFRSAARTCQHLLPGGGPHSQSDGHSPAQIAAALAFARCLRGHGFPSFPDPTSTGDITHEMLAEAGINLHQPAVVQAADACVGVTHGYITQADVARFIAGQ
jgi:hypothetical protein